MKQKHITSQGMKMPSCIILTVTEKLSAVKGARAGVQVDLESKSYREGNHGKWSLKRALKGTKFELGDEI